MSYSSRIGISHRTPDSTMRGVTPSSHIPTFVGLCHKCWTSNTVLSLTNSNEILCNKCFGGDSR